GVFLLRSTNQLGRKMLDSLQSLHTLTDQNKEACPLRWRTIVWGESPGLIAPLVDAVASCGSTPSVLDRHTDPEYSSECCVAVIAGALSCAESHRSEIIAGLKAKGFHVIACQDGAETWPLAARCKLLLAGCATLLDSSDPAFAEELGRWLVQVFR